MVRYLLSVAGWMIACLAAPVILFILLEPLLADMAVWLRAVAIVGEVLLVLVISPVAGLILNNCIEKMKYGCLLERVFSVRTIQCLGRVWLVYIPGLGSV